MIKTHLESEGSREGTTNNRALRAAVVLFGDVLTLIPDSQLTPSLAYPPFIASWWERAVALTIVTRSISGTDVFSSLGKGPRFIPTVLPPLTVRFAAVGEAMESAGVNELTMSRQGGKGFDAFVRLGDSVVYLQMKIAASTQSKNNNKTNKGSSRETEFADAVFNSLKAHHNGFPDIAFDHVSIVFYEWTDIPSCEDELHKLAIQLTATAKFNRGDDEDFNNKLSAFIANSMQTNLFILDKKVLDQWLLPTMAVIPRLVEKVICGSPTAC